jgi:uncharacterized protein
MKIIVISDTHIPDRAESLPLKLLDEIKNADMVIHAGDFVSLEFLNDLKSLCNNIKAVWGNMDPPEIKKMLPQKGIFKVGDYRIGVVHGYGAPNKMLELLNTEFKNDKLDIIIFGHSHSALNEKRGSTLFFNPGSPTDKILAADNTYGIIEIDGGIQAKVVTI